MHHTLDRAYVDYLVSGMQKGFRIGFEWGKPLKSVKSNLLSSALKPDAISSYIATELDKKRLIVPFCRRGGQIVM